MLTNLSLKFRNSYDIFVRSAGIIRQHPKLLLLTVLNAMVVTVGAIGVVLVILLGLAMSDSQAVNISAEATEEEVQANAKFLLYACVVPVYFVMSFVLVFFQTAMMRCIFDIFDGKKPSLRHGLAFASRRVHRIALWSLINCTVGVVIMALKERAGWIAWWILQGIEVVWNVAVMFVVPALVASDLGAVDAIKRSAAVVKRTWGEALVTQFGFTFFVGVVVWASLLACLGASAGLFALTNNGWFFAVFMLPWFLAVCVLMFLSSALKQIMLAGLYRMCFEGDGTSTAPIGPFTRAQLGSVVVAAKARR